MRKLDYSWVILATGFVVLFFSGGSRFAFGVVLKPMSDELGWSRTSLTLAATACLVVSALAMPVVGRLVDRYNIRWVIASAALLAASAIGLMGLVSEPWHVFVLYGLLYAMGSAGMSAGPVGVMVSRWFTRSRGLANSVAISGNAVGQLVIITLLASLVASMGWRSAFMVLGIVNAAVVVPLVLAAVRSYPPSQPPAAELQPAGHPIETNRIAAFSSIFSSRQLWLLFVIYAICGIQDFFVATHVVAFALDQGVGPVLAGNMLAWMGLMGLIGVLVSGFLADKFGAVWPTGLCFLMRIGIFAFVLLFQSTASIVAFALMYGFTFLITAPLTVVYAGSLFGAARLGTVSGLISMVHQIAAGAGAVIGAVVFDLRGSYDWAFALMLALSVVAAAATTQVREKPLAQVGGAA